MHNVLPDKLPINWFDFMVVVVMLLGARKGRQQGLSLEMLPMFQWLAIIGACTYGYRPVGDFMAQSMPLSHLFCYIVGYIAVALFVKIFFSAVSKALGGKLIGSDVFGVGEFYLGILAGMVRYACIIVAGIALLNARLYTPQEIAAKIAFQNDVYGSNFFPELPTVQSGVFVESLVGKQIKKHASFLLIKPTLPEKVGIGGRKDDLP